MVQAVRPDRLQSAMALFACKTLGKLIFHQRVSMQQLNIFLSYVSLLFYSSHGILVLGFENVL